MTADQAFLSALESGLQRKAAAEQQKKALEAEKARQAAELMFRREQEQRLQQEHAANQQLQQNQFKMMLDQHEAAKAHQLRQDQMLINQGLTQGTLRPGQGFTPPDFRGDLGPLGQMLGAPQTVVNQPGVEKTQVPGGEMFTRPASPEEYQQTQVAQQRAIEAAKMEEAQKQEAARYRAMAKVAKEVALEIGLPEQQASEYAMSMISPHLAASAKQQDPEVYVLNQYIHATNPADAAKALKQYETIQKMKALGRPIQTPNPLPQQTSAAKKHAGQIVTNVIAALNGKKKLTKAELSNTINAQMLGYLAQAPEAKEHYQEILKLINEAFRAEQDNTKGGFLENIGIKLSDAPEAPK